MRPPAIASTIPRPRKVVRFPSEKSLATVVEIEAAKKEEKASTWYQREDYGKFRHDIQATLLELIQIEEDMRYWDASNFTLRGIEQHFSRRYRSQRRSIQKMMVQTVLNAQKEYGHKGEDACRRIERLSRMCSKAARKRAQEVGALDQFAAGLGRPPSAQQKPSKPLIDSSWGISTPTRRPSLMAQSA